MAHMNIYIFICDYITSVYLRFIKKLLYFKIIINFIFFVILICMTPLVDTTTSLNETILVVEILVLGLSHLCYIGYLECSEIIHIKYLITVIMCDIIYTSC